MTSSLPQDIDLSIGPGHRPADEHLAHLKLGRSFLAGPHAGEDIIRLRWYVRESDGALVGRVWFGPGAQGPPGHAHGGSMAAVLDEALGSSCWVAGHPVVAAELTTSFRAMLPLGTVATVEAWIEKADGRKLYPKGHILADDGTVYAEASGLFIEMTSEAFDALADRLE
ncbi:PaaI family thioesterase [Persicimonas caeni]|uniref:PaaI family thioesterase n=1 Tax=Persicimonas caeni TaxID=2292766 RepID=UPI00143D756E|nr:PaaI family thioesterase [Persicimonas caeni]